MKKKLLSLLLVLFSLNFYAQVSFEKAYFINNTGIKTDCFIKNKDQGNNPTSFEYKLNLNDSQILNENIKNVKEFKIGDILKYERATVALDTSGVNIDAIKENREPEWKEVTVFLKTLVDSKTSLYVYVSGNLKCFFYKKDDTNIEQLIYKKYIIDEESYTKIASNNDFQKQLWQNLNCGNKNIDDFLKIRYKLKDLTKFFIEYNKCKNNTIVDFGKKVEPGSVNLKLKVGMTSSSLAIFNNYSKVDVDFGKKTNLTYGAEFEWILPFNRNKWSLFFAPSYNSYENSGTGIVYNTGPFSSDTRIENWKASVKHLDFAAGFRYYMFLSSNSKIFISGSFIVSNVLDSDIHEESASGYQLTAKFANSLGYGLGYSYKNKVNIELKHSSANIFDNYIFFNSHYNLTSIVVGYTIFDTKKKK